MTAPINVSSEIWLATWEGLRERGNGLREAACVWAGRRRQGRWSVEDVIFIDDLPGTHASALRHSTSPKASAALFGILRSRNLAIAADIHTHPDDWVGLSEIDQLHPIEYRVGLIALVLPWYGEVVPSLHVTGVHEYAGDGEWRLLEPAEVVETICLDGGDGR